MKKYFNRLLLAIILLATSGVVAAQQMPAIPVDPNVRIGKLDNGLTYYIRHNEYPKGQADFYIAQKVGSVLEEDNQRGLAHFLEHMCFNGTKNFPGNEIVSWLETVGVKFGRNLNAYTSIDETVYNICEVPTARVGVQDSCLLIIHDWANDLLLSDEEIDKERSVIHEEWRSRNTGQSRVIEALLPLIYPGERYGYRSPIGTMEVVDNFPSQALRDYYHKWYRPDLQGIVIVGDIDVDRIEGKIKEIFSDIKKPVNPAKREYFPVADNKETIYAIGKDKEIDRAIIEIMYKHEARPDSLKGTVDYLIESYLLDMGTRMLNTRLSDLASKPEAVFSGGSVDYDGFFYSSKTKDAFSIGASPKDNDVVKALEAVYREALRAQRGGFTASEYDRARKEYLSRLEQSYNNRNTITSTSLVNGYVRNFLDNEPIPGIENRYQIMSALAEQIPVEAINQVFTQVMPDSNIVVLALLPDNGKYVIPTEQDIDAMMKRVQAENIEAYVDEVKSEPLIERLPKPGKIVKTTTNKVYGTTIWTLSNGAKVVVKPTDFKDNEILFTAYAKGGTSAYGSDYDLDLRYIANGGAVTGLGSYNLTDLNKYLSGKQAFVTADFGDYEREVSGHTVIKDLPTLMELIYMTFTNTTIDADEFEARRHRIAASYKNRDVNPNFQFSKRLMKSIYNSPRHYALDTVTINSASRENILKIYHEMLANAGEYTFYFVGNVDLDTLKPLVEQYIATLPGKAVKSSAIKYANLGIKKGSATDQEKYKMDTPTTYAAIIVGADIPYTSKNQKLASIAGQILSARLVKIVREDEGAVYSISASGGLSRIGETPMMIQSSFPMKPEMKDKVLSIIAAQMEDMTTNINSTELNKVKEYMVKEYTASLKKNSPWMNAIIGYDILPVDTLTNSIADVNAITEADVADFMKQVMKQNNYRVFILEPEE